LTPKDVDTVIPDATARTAALNFLLGTVIAYKMYTASAFKMKSP
jgi:hypothetical protein